MPSPPDGDGDTDTSAPKLNPACAGGPVPVPIPFQTISGYGDTEDFVFDVEGNIVLCKNGNVTKIDKAGDPEIIATGIGATAGTGRLPNGSFVFASGDTLKVVYPDGGSKTLLSGLNQPNGLDIDHEGYVFVAEMSGNRLRKVHGETGEFEIVADGLNSPNGVAFGPGYDKVYVGSFGGGTVHVLHESEDGSWGPPQLFAKIDGDATVVGPPPEPIELPNIVYEPCLGKPKGQPCLTAAGWAGACDGTGSDCVQDPGAESPAELGCAGRTSGSACAVTLWGAPYKGSCVSSTSAKECCANKGTEGCPAPECQTCVCGMVPYCCSTAWDSICSGHAKNECKDSCLCDVELPAGTADILCAIKPDPIAYCAGLKVGDICPFVSSADKVLGGKCMDLATITPPPSFPKSGVGCVVPEMLVPIGGGGGGGLDGLNVNECGYVYVTEYVLGNVWRVRPDGIIYKAAAVPSGWIPNIKFSPGIGGWDPKLLYVNSLGDNIVFALEIGVRGKEVTAPIPVWPPVPLD